MRGNEIVFLDFVFVLKKQKESKNKAKNERKKKIGSIKTTTYSTKQHQQHQQLVNEHQQVQLMLN